MKEYFNKYVALRKHNAVVAWKKAKKSKNCYLFLLPYAIIFTLFFVAPVVVSVFFGFTYYNVLEPPRFLALQNYTSLILEDDIFLTSIKNTMLIAIITGPLGYIAAFLFAWLINELPRWIRSVAVIVFYVPSITGAACLTIFSNVLLKGDRYGLLNSWLIEMGIIDTPIIWLITPAYMLPFCMVAILWQGLGAGFLSFVAGLQGIDRSQYEAGYMDGVKNRWQELWYITLPNMKPMLLFGAVMSITGAFSQSQILMTLCGYPSTDYAARTIVTHLYDYGFTRFEMGYASAIATILFLMMLICNKAIQSLLGRVGT